MKFRIYLYGLCLLLSNFGSAQQNPFPISEAGLDYLSGQALFEKVWVSAPSSTRASDGLGPLYNARSCAQCHQGAGKGRPDSALIFRIADETYGRQLQGKAVRGIAAEPLIGLSYSSKIEVLADSTEIMLHQPEYQLSEILTHALPFSPRLAPSLWGVGLLAAIPLNEILARADPDDTNMDGISGRAGVGRFGWKADVGSLEEQVALALSLDMGISSALKPNPMGDCTSFQNECLTLPNGASSQDDFMEIGEPAFTSLLNFVNNIPLIEGEHTNQSTPVTGQLIFQQIGCLACHQTDYSEGSINPYSDLLLHDMGESLADSLGTSIAREWRTPPLWGLAAYSQLEEQFYLHDGRARSLTEAVLWHAGEAEHSKQAFAALSQPERDDLIGFLQGL